MGPFDIIIAIDKATPYILLCCLVIGFIRYNKIEVHFKVMLYYLLLAIVANISMKLLGHYFKNNLILIPLYGLFELVLFTILYAYYMDLKKLRYVNLTIGLIGCSYIIYEVSTVNTAIPSDFQSYARPVDAFIIVLFSMIYFFDKLSKGTDLSDSAIRLNTIILIFFSLNLIFLLPLNFLIGQNSNDLKFYFWISYISMITIFYLFITYTIWKNGKTQKH